MKFTTIALAVALTVPSSFALARGGMHGGGMHIGSHVTRPFANPVGTGRVANRPRNATGNTLAPIAHDPSGSTLTGSATNRTGGYRRQKPASSSGYSTRHSSLYT